VICWHKIAVTLVKASFSFSCRQVDYNRISWGTGRVFTTGKRLTSRMSWRLVPFIALTCAVTTWKLHRLHRDLAPIGLADGRLSGGLITQSRRLIGREWAIQLRGLIERTHLIFGHYTNFHCQMSQEIPYVFIVKKVHVNFHVTAKVLLQYRVNRDN